MCRSLWSLNALRIDRGGLACPCMAESVPVFELISQESVSEITLRYQLIYWYLICLIRLKFGEHFRDPQRFCEICDIYDCGGRPTGEGPSRPENMAGNA